MIATELYHVSSLRNLSSEQIVEECAPLTREVFAKAAQLSKKLAVVLSVKDEQDDLPATITALALSRRPVVTVVASNGSTDSTVEIAKNMVGEDNVIDIEEPGLIGARQEGVRHVQRQFGSQVVLFTDGDTLMPPHWAGNMETMLEKIDTGNGALLGGRVIWTHGSNRMNDAAITAKAVWHITHAKVTQQAPKPQGANQGLRFDPDGRMMEGLMSLEPSIFFHDELAMRDVMVAAGATVSYPMNPAIVGLTRGDRYSTLDKIFARKPERRDRILASYHNQYGSNLGSYKSS